MAAILYWSQCVNSDTVILINLYLFRLYGSIFNNVITEGTSPIKFMSTIIEIVARSTPQNTFNHKSMLI